MSPPHEIELEFATVRLRENGILEIIVKRNAEVGVADAQATHAAMRKLCDGPALVLADIRGLRRSGVATERYVAGPETTDVARRLALLIESPVSRMLGNLKMGLAKPPFPTRLFTNEDAAVAWLLADSAEDAVEDDECASDSGKGHADADRDTSGHSSAA